MSELFGFLLFIGLGVYVTAIIKRDYDEDKK